MCVVFILSHYEKKTKRDIRIDMCVYWYINEELNYNLQSKNPTVKIKLSFFFFICMCAENFLKVKTQEYNPQKFTNFLKVNTKRTIHYNSPVL